MNTPAPTASALPFAIFADELEALHRFYETTEDGQDYDVPVPMMKRLAVIGLVRRVTGNRYEFTNFGLSVRNGDFDAAQPASSSAPAVGGDEPTEAMVNAMVRRIVLTKSDGAPWEDVIRLAYMDARALAAPAGAAGQDAAITPVRVKVGACEWDERYYLSAKLGGEKVEREVTQAEFIAAEQAAGFRSKYPGRPATGGFSSGLMSGRVSSSTAAALAAQGDGGTTA